MTVAEIQALIDQGVSILKQTTVGYANHSPAWQANPSTKWWQGLDKLAQARKALDVAPAPPPPAGLVIAPPQGTLTVKDGGGTQEAGVFSRDVGSPDIGGLNVKRYTGYGVGQMAWNGGPVASTGTSYIHDLKIADIAGVPPRVMDGRGEAGLWLGQRTLAERFEISRCAWMGLWTGADCHDSIVQDFRLTGMPHVGAYLEHDTVSTVFRRFQIALAEGSDGNAVNSEWWYGGHGSHSNEFYDFDIYVPKGCWAFFLDAGTYGCRIGRGRIWGPGNGIAHPQQLADPTKPNYIDWGTIDTSGLTGTKEWKHGNAIGA